MSSRADGSRWSRVLGRGPGRRAAHRRVMLRRAASALLVGLAVMIGWGQLRGPAAAPIGERLVAARDLPAGTRLTASDLVAEPLSAGGRLGTHSSRPLEPGRTDAEPLAPTQVVGRVTATPLLAGEAVTPTRLVGPDLLRAQPRGTRAVWLPASTAEEVAAVSAGARVDVHRAGHRGPVLRAALVLARTPAGPGLATDGGPTVDGGPTAGILSDAGHGVGPGLLVAAPAETLDSVLGSDPGADGSGAFRFALLPIDETR